MQCPVCYELYALPDPMPKVLICGHTFCATCIVQLTMDKLLVCPTCRSPCAESEVHTNFSMHDLLSQPAAAAPAAAAPAAPSTENDHAIALVLNEAETEAQRKRQWRSWRWQRWRWSQPWTWQDGWAWQDGWGWQDGWQDQQDGWQNGQWRQRQQ